MTATVSKVLAYPKSLRLSMLATVVTTLMLLTFVLAAQGKLRSLDGLLALGLLAVLGGLSWLHLERTRLELNATGVSYQSLGKSCRLRWIDLDDLHSSPRLIVLSAGPRGRLRLFRGEHGFSLEPFEALQDRIAEEVETRFVARWDSAPLPRTYHYPRVSAGTLPAYAVPLALVLLFFGVFVAGVSGSWPEKLAFLALGLGVVLPFLARDVLRSGKRLELGREGLRELNGKETRISWSAIREVVVREPISIGLGSFEVVADTGVRIRIPRGIVRAGEFFHLLGRHTHADVNYSHDY